MRKARTSDLIQILDVERNSFPPGRQATPETLRLRLGLFPEGSFVFVLNNKVVAFTTALTVREPKSILDLNPADELIHRKDGDSYYLRSLAVRKEFQGRGYGKELVQKQLENARKLGKKFFVFTCSEDVEKFYAKLGFKRVGGYVDFHGTKQSLWKKRL